MANLLIAIDPNAERLAAYLSRASRRIAPLPGLMKESRSGPGWGALWARCPNAPVSVEVSARGGAMVWGDALDTKGGRQCATSLLEQWHRDVSQTWDGYFAAAVLNGSELTLGSDLLGIFPLYYWQGADVLLVGTSPELFAEHPRFSAHLDVNGLVGILLTNGLAGGATLWKGVRRIQPGHQLRLREGRVSEVEVYRIPETQAAVSLPLAAHGAMLGEAMLAAVRRHFTFGQSHGLLLSGGLDSRMVAGLLVRIGIKPRALILGLPSDLEGRCARAVARALHLDAVNAEPDPTEYPELARLQAEWEHLSNGFSLVRDWWTRSRVGQLGSRLATGILADAAVGGVAIAWAYSSNPPTMSYEAFTRQMPQLHLPAPVLRRLLKAEYVGLVDDTLDRLRAEYEGYSDQEAQRAWRYDLAHGQRFHVGATPWRLSFGAWPVIPMLDRDLLAAAASIPAASMADRSAQLELIKQLLPELNQIPIDRSDLLQKRPQYIAPRLRHVIENGLRAGLERYSGKLPVRLPNRETRYWYRINDFEGAGWRSVRAAAEPFRDRVSRVFNLELLDKVLPPPGHPVAQDAPQVQPAGRKLLLGFLCWAASHL